MRNFFTKGLFIFVAILFAQNFVYAQDIMDVAPGEGNAALVGVINGDTTSTGERANLNRIYRLERGQMYLVSSTIFANYPIRIIAGGDENLRPPMLVAGKDATGKNIRPFFKLSGEGTINYFHDVFFNAVDLDREIEIWSSCTVVSGDSMSTAFEGCVFNAYTGGANQFSGKDNSIYFRDCIWRNGVSPVHQFIGQQISIADVPVDTLVVTNCTYFNNNSYWLVHGNAVKFCVIEHNTIFTSIIDEFALAFPLTVNIRSNLFYGTGAFGDTETSRANTWYEKDSKPYGIMSFFEAPSKILEDAGMTEDERVFNLTNNAWFSPQAYKDYWNADESISGITWMNSRNDSLFNDNEGHPYFTAKDNVEKDPVFTDTDMDSWVIGKVVSFCTTYRATDSDNGHALDGNAGDFRNYDESKGVDILTEIPWPLPEQLAFSDAALLVAGHDGLPVGNLNYHAGMREQYVEPTEIEKGVTSEPFASKQTPALTDKFFAKWNVTPTHMPMDGATGFSKTPAEGSFGNMGILVRFNATGNIDARNGGGYEALEDLAYEAGKKYTIEVTANVKAQTYTVTVTPDGGTKTTIGTDYAFRANTPQDTLNHFSMIINEITAWGGVEGSRLNPSFLDDPFTNESFELNVANNAAIEGQTGAITAFFDMAPTVAPIDAAFGFSKDEIGVQGYSGMSAYLVCNSSGFIVARDGGGFNSENEITYEAGKKYAVEMAIDVTANTYSVTITPEGSSTIVLATDYEFRSAADTLKNTAELIGIGGLWGSNPGDLIVSNLRFTTTGINNYNVPEFNVYPNPVNDKLTVSFKDNVEFVEVHSLLGKQVITQQTFGQTKTILDVSALPQGVYVVHVFTPNGKGSKLFVKQ